LVRGEVLSLKTREYVQAAITIGQPTARIIWSQVLPQHDRADHRHGLADDRLGDPAGILASPSSALGDPNLMSWGYMVGAGRTRLPRRLVESASSRVSRSS
jgi:peptide/nickel transport system permease protein